MGQDLSQALSHEWFHLTLTTNFWSIFCAHVSTEELWPGEAEELCWGHTVQEAAELTAEADLRWQARGLTVGEMSSQEGAGKRTK